MDRTSSVGITKHSATAIISIGLSNVFVGVEKCLLRHMNTPRRHARTSKIRLKAYECKRNCSFGVEKTERDYGGGFNIYRWASVRVSEDNVVPARSNANFHKVYNFGHL